MNCHQRKDWSKCFAS